MNRILVVLALIMSVLAPALADDESHHHEDLSNLPFPMLADIKHDLCEQLVIIDPAQGVAQRATFIVDSDNVIRFVYVTDVAGSPGTPVTVVVTPWTCALYVNVAVAFVTSAAPWKILIIAAALLIVSAPFLIVVG